MTVEDRAGLSDKERGTVHDSTGTQRKDETRGASWRKQSERSLKEKIESRQTQMKMKVSSRWKDTTWFVRIK